MDGDAAKLLALAKEMRALATTIKSEDHRRLLLETAEKYELRAKQAQEVERKR